MKEKDIYKGFETEIKYSILDRRYVGTVKNGSHRLAFQGRTMEEAKSSFHEAVDDYLQETNEAK